MTTLAGLGVIVAVAVLIHAMGEISGRAAALGVTLGDADDAARLAQVRAWLGGAGWFDLHTSRFGLADGLLSHWSRLVDAGIGGLVVLFGLVFAPGQAETLARMIWPLVVFAPVAFVIALAADRLGGRMAAISAMLLLLTCLSGLHPFAVGRIDHHGVMILGAVGAALLCQLSLRDIRFAVPAGGLAAMGLAVGFEGLVLTVLAVGTLAVAAILDRRHVDAARRVTIALALGLVVGFLLTTPPGRWLDARCDALSVNLVVAGLIGAVAMACLSHSRLPDRPALRFLVLVAGGVAALLAYRAFNPLCMAGPFGEVDPAIGPIWLDSVRETFPIWRVFGIAPAVVLVFTAFAALGLMAQSALVRGASELERAPALAGFVVLAGAVALACWQLKLMPYASLLVIVPIAVLAAKLMERDQLIGAVALVLASSQLVLGAVAQPIADALPKPAMAAAMDDDSCRETAAFAGLAGLPRGRVLVDLNVASHVVALTPHDVLAGPYHRLSWAILASHALWSGTDMAAVRAGLASAKITYVVLCAAHGADAAPGSLLARLAQGHAPAFLAPVGAQGALRLWQVQAAD